MSRSGRRFGGNGLRSEWKLLGLGAAMMFTLGMLQSLLPMPKDTPFEHLFDRPRDAYLLSIIAVTLGPLMEEIFFRGFMYPVLARRMGAAWAIVLTALPFGLIHLPQYGWAWGAALVIVLVGVVCGVVRAVTGSVGGEFSGARGIQRCTDDHRDRVHTWVPALEKAPSLVRLKVPARNQH